MPFLFRRCELEMDHEAYMDFLLRHHSELNLPYPFAMKLSFISSPLVLGKAMLIFSEELYQVVGAAGFVYGTGQGDYKDRHICQVEAAFILKEHRRTALFVQALQALLDAMKAGNPDVQQLQFWAAADQEELKRLFAKLSSLPGSTKSIVNSMALYTVSFHELEAYCRRLRVA
jgi:hypothetical protein